MTLCRLFAYAVVFLRIKALLNPLSRGILVAFLSLFGGCATDPSGGTPLAESAITYFTFARGEVEIIVNASAERIVAGAVLFDINTTTQERTRATHVEEGLSVDWPSSVTVSIPNCNSSPELEYTEIYETYKLFFYAFPVECSFSETDTFSALASITIFKDGESRVLSDTGNSSGEDSSPGVWAQEAYVKAPNADAGDQFGECVAISGDTMVVGAQYEASNQTTITNGPTASADNSGGFVGAAYIFKRSGATWTQEAYLKAVNANLNDFYGRTVAISGDTVLVGARGESSNQTTITNGATASADNSAVDAGAVYVYKRSGTTWTQEAYLKAPNAEANDSFGFGIAISSDTIAVGAYGESSNQTTITNGNTASGDNSAGNSGAVYVFKRSGSNWAQEAYIKAPNANGADVFGYSVSISGDTLVVGAYAERSNQTTITNGATASADNSLVLAGAAYVFTRSGSSWAQEAYLKAPNAEGSDHFGYSVSIHSDTIVVGAYGEDSNQTTITNGTTASADNSIDQAGAAYVFKRTGTNWAQEAYLKAPNSETFDSFGESVAVFSDTVVVGAAGEDSNQTTITNGSTASANNGASSSGAAYVFKRSGATWAQEAYVKAPNGEANDGFGRSVAISGDTVIVGAYVEDSNQTTITNGATASADNSAAAAGAVYVFTR